MFTGIVDHCGTVREFKAIANGACAVIETQFSDFSVGESIAVDGICLTLVNGRDPRSRPSDLSRMTAEVEISPETVAKTTAKYWKKDSVVNLERALSVGDRLGGHWVTGHVDDVVQVAEINLVNQYREVKLFVNQQEQLRYLVPKGSVALNGVSLTINTVFENGFSVMLIPHTQAVTNLDNLKVGDRLNVEFDYLIKAVMQENRHPESDSGSHRETQGGPETSSGRRAVKSGRQ